MVGMGLAFSVHLKLTRDRRQRPMSALILRADQRQHQTLSPRLQQAVRLLQLSSMEFAQEVRQALDTNPFLETAEDDGPVLSDDAALSAALPLPAVGDGIGVVERDARDSIDPDGDLPSDSAPDAAEEHDDWHLSGSVAGSGDSPRPEDGESSPMNRVAAPTSLADALHGQLNVLPLPPRDLVLAKAIVDSLDDDGYLRLDDLDELVAVTALDPPAAPDELQIALRRVQSLEPAGVGARNVVECLSLQLDGIACPEQRALARLIISERLDALAGKDMVSLARILDRPLPLVADTCAAIRRLDPRPGWRLGHADIRYVTPDVIVRRGRSRWLVLLNPAVVPRVRLHRVYAELFSRQRDESHPQMAEQLREARWTLRNVEQRFATILGVAQAIVKRQHLFFEYGPAAMKPLGLREIADEVGVHESTVSRVTSNKYMATPSGVFELKYFFSRAMTAGDGGQAYSGTAVRGLIKEMLEHEEVGQRLSDAEITRRLARQGLVVARRTVTKYRHQLRVDSVGRRRADEVEAARDGAPA
jgi:RNA polymerase sigma-54 factor